MSLPAVLFLLRWQTRDTLRLARCSAVFWILIAVTVVCTLLCLSVGVEGGVALRRSDEAPEFLPRTEAAVQERAGPAGRGVDVVSGSLTLGFGALRIPLGRDVPDVVRFLELLLAGVVADAAGILLMLVWTAGFLPRFLAPGGAEVLLAKPVPRWALLGGKYVGVLVLVALHASLFVGGTWVALGVATGHWDPAYLLCVPLLLLQFAAIYGVSVLIAVCTRSTAACVLGSVLFWCVSWCLNFGRHMLVVLPSLEPASERPTGLLGWFVEAAYWIFPKPVDFSLLLQQVLRAGDHFGRLATFDAVLQQGAFCPELSIVTSLLFAVSILGIASWQLAATDY